MHCDVIIAGAGIVGLASAYQLSRLRPGLRILVVEKEEGVARHQTGRNSGVIHSGVYYKPGQTRAIHCRRGYRLLLDFCEENQIPYELTGKVIVALREEELPRLHEIHRRGEANGLEELRWLNGDELREVEPEAGGLAALWVPQAGIVSYRRVAEAYRMQLEAAGGEVRFGATVHGVQRRTAEIVVQTAAGDFTTRLFINCAGLYSDKLTRLTGMQTSVQILPFRGEYYRLRPEREHLVRHLIYPVPNPNFPFLGVHFTPMIEGGVEAGPNAVLAFAREGYSNRQVHWAELAETLRYPGFRRLAGKYWRDGLDELRRSFSKAAFVRALRPLLPAITADDLVPGGAGVRAMACGPDGELIDDFLFYEAPGIINVANAPSPAATASLAIGETVAEKALAQLE